MLHVFNVQQLKCNLLLVGAAITKGSLVTYKKWRQLVYKPCGIAIMVESFHHLNGKTCHNEKSLMTVKCYDFDLKPIKAELRLKFKH